MVRILSQFFLNFVPVLLEFRFFVGQDDGAVLVFEFFDEDIDLVADFDGLEIDKFVAGDHPFAFIADVHKNFLGTDFDDGTFDDFTCGEELAALLQGFFHCKHNFSGMNNCGEACMSQGGLEDSIA